MAEIVLVHGIDQQQKSADVLENEWLPALAGGVRTAGHGDLADRIWRDRAGPRGIEARMAFYGHLFLEPGAQGDDAGELSGAGEELAERLAVEWLERAAAQGSRRKDRETASRELAYLRREIGAEEMGIGELARKAVNSLARVRWFAPLGMALAERFVRRALAQVTRYLTDEATRQAALRSVLELAEDDTRVILAHSLGSVVAFEACQSLTRDLPLLVTIGSPLGLETIIYPKLRPQPPVFPSRVRRWVNVADRDDFIAAEPDLAPMFSEDIPVGAAFEGGYTVDNGAEPHRADFYLSKAEVGRPVAEALSRAWRG